MATESFGTIIIIDDSNAESFFNILENETKTKVNLKTSEKIERFKHWSKLMRKEMYNVKERTENMIKEVNELNDFMRTEDFYNLQREQKDLYYDLFHSLITSLQLLGRISELKKVKIELK